MRGSGTVFRRGKTWWIAYWHGGQRFRESARTEVKPEAANQLRAKLEARASGRAVPETRFLVREAVEAYLANLELRRGPGAAASARKKTKPVLGALGSVRASDLSAGRMDRHIADRRRKVGPATCNRETAYLRAVLRFAHKRGKLGRVPGFTMLAEPAPRQGFWSSLAEFERFAALVEDDDVREMARFSYLTGWRRSEVLGPRWEWVDRGARPDPEVRLPRRKNGEERTLPLVGQLKDLVERRWERRKLTRPDGTVFVADLVFHRNGRAIRDFRATWDDALDKAKVPRRTWHDFRRTAARSLVNAGVPEEVAMEITGHKTASIFRRCHITTQADRAAALRKAMAHVEAEVAESSNVKPIAEPGSAK